MSVVLKENHPAFSLYTLPAAGRQAGFIALTHRHKSIYLILFLFLFLLFLTGCGNFFYFSKLGWHQSFITFQSVPVQEALRDEALGDEAKKKIHIIQEVKRYGEERLGLRRTGSYTKFFEVRIKSQLSG